MSKYESYHYSGVIHRDNRHTPIEEDDMQMPFKKKRKKKHQKSKHKHEYIPGVYHLSYVGVNSNEKHEHITCGSHCKYCGRVNDMFFMWSREGERVEQFKKQYPNYVEIVLPEGWDYFKDKNIPI